ncbi:MAG: acyltransferase family protein [Clostridium sp.]
MNGKLNLKGLTGIRGFAALLVFTAHTPIRHVIGDFGQEAVYIFFFLSAFLLTISLQRQNKLEYTKRRFWRIYPLYFVVVIVAGLIRHFSLGDIGLNLLFLQGINGHFILDVSWSLIVEIQLYIILPILVYLIAKYEKKAVIGIIILAYIIRIILFPYYMHRVMDEGSMRVVYGTVFEFLDIFSIGVYLALKRDKLMKYKISNKVMIIIIVIAGITPKILEIVHANRAVSVLFIIIPIYSILIPIAFIGILSKQKILTKVFENKILLFYGEISYSFYLIHRQMLLLLKYQTFLTDRILAGGIAFVLTTILAYITYNLIEKKFLVK